MADEFIHRNYLIKQLYLVTDISLTSPIMQTIKTFPAADVQPVDRWISTKDRLPDVGQPVLIYYPCWDGTEVQAARLEYDKLFFEICGEFNASVNKVTHWQPLPVPPKD